MTSLDILKAKADSRYRQAKKVFYVGRLCNYSVYALVLYVYANSQSILMAVLDIQEPAPNFIRVLMDLVLIIFLFNLLQDSYKKIKKVFTDWTCYLTDEERRKLELDGDCSCDG